jgi:hypothetical protein
MALHYTPGLASDIRCDDSLQNRQIGARKDTCCDQALPKPNPSAPLGRITCELGMSRQLSEG